MAASSCAADQIDGLRRLGEAARRGPGGRADEIVNTSGCHVRQFLVEGSHVADMTSPVKTGSSSRAAVA
jgi:hypothetical protein